ncbi:MAG: SDR family NAD(P)-dependent oxidoreductase [Rhizomicrobium sp.]|nr:SDR family NAD(P)-dependent oxidoreductase [Rhizomicrobium sp.]
MYRCRAAEAAEAWAHHQPVVSRGRTVRPGSAVYAATKAGILMISEALRQEVKPYMLRTTVIAPGAVATALQPSITEPTSKKGFSTFMMRSPFQRIASRAWWLCAMSQPDHVDVNEVLLRSTRQQGWSRSHAILGQAAKFGPS